MAAVCPSHAPGGPAAARQCPLKAPNLHLAQQHSTLDVRCVLALPLFDPTLQELVSVKHGSWHFTATSVALRTALLAVCVGVAIVVPFFSLVMSFIGAFMSMSISIVLPCIFHLVVCAEDVTRLDRVLSVAVAMFGVAAGSMATYEAITAIYSKY
eukprot:GHRQ01010702.1.p1 GENE.GHRQ01010702.1~~GHRQ01010702.1.p1  ORF type:complete len:155 (-),score=50.46 GHRQ01010702.1:650-1114(-)